MKRTLHILLIVKTMTLYQFQLLSLNARWVFVRLGLIKQKISTECAISLTSYPSRFKSLNIVLKCLLTQSIRVPELRVYIDSGHEYNSRGIMNKYEKFGVKFIFCDEVLKSYTKLIPSLRELGGIPVITVDDDVLYGKSMVEDLLRYHKLYPGCAIGHRAVIRPLDSNLGFTYKDWPEARFTGKAGYDVFLTGMAGILYPPDSFNEIVLDTKLFKLLAPTADDLWFNYCLRKHGTKSFVIANKNRDPFSIRGSQTAALWVKNVDGRQNDLQRQNIISELGPLD